MSVMCPILDGHQYDEKTEAWVLLEIMARRLEGLDLGVNRKRDSMKTYTEI